jgi:phenylacetate-CoA ligase
MIFEVLSTWNSLQRSQWHDKSKLAKLQDLKLRRIVDLAIRRVPFYSRFYQSHGADPERIKGVLDLPILPIVMREHLQREGIGARTAIGTDLDTCMLRSTSGTTGTPLQVYEDQTSVAFRDALNLRLLWAYGVRPFHRLCRTRISDSTGLEPKPRLSDVGLWGFFRRHGMKQILYTTDPAKAVMILADWRPDIIFGDPAYLRLLVKATKTTGLEIKCKTVITSGQVLDESTRSYIGIGFQAEVYDHYGLEEVGGSVAWECPTHSGYHVNDESVILEFLRDGQPVAFGKPGEIHVTSLTRTVTPIIRYATGDIGVPLEDECECGRGLSLLKDIQGRIMDYVVTKDGRYVPSNLIIGGIEALQGIEDYKVFQNVDQTIDLHVRITKGMEDTALLKLKHVCSNLFGDTPARIINVDHVNQATGRKFRIVESAFTNKLPVA